MQVAERISSWRVCFFLLLFVAVVSFAYCFELSKCQLSFSKILFRNHKCYVSTLSGKDIGLGFKALAAALLFLDMWFGRVSNSSILGVFICKMRGLSNTV